MTQVTSVDAYWLGKNNLRLAVAPDLRFLDQPTWDPSSIPLRRRASMTGVCARRLTESSLDVQSWKQRWPDNVKSKC